MILHHYSRNNYTPPSNILIQRRMEIGLQLKGNLSVVSLQYTMIWRNIILARQSNSLGEQLIIRSQQSDTLFYNYYVKTKNI